MPSLAKRPEHEPAGDPCIKCGLPEAAHRRRAPRPEHDFTGTSDICSSCGLSIRLHRNRPRHSGGPGTRQEKRWSYVGIDGEGQGKREHRYVILAASDESGARSWYIQEAKGLHTVECLDFILDLPLDTQVFSYGFNYDLTKILEDLTNEALYYLFRPELRKRKGKCAQWGPKPVVWQGYSLNLQGTKFSVAKQGRSRVIWDVWKFFQGKFVNALKNWKVGEAASLVHMQHMKDKRSDFDKENLDGVREYCLSECRYMAELAHKLVDAHTTAGLELRSFYGAGSTGGAILNKMGIKEKIRPVPEAMREAVAAAFAGGRFENSVIGIVNGTVYNKDISSAYPYQLCFLPCLEHGVWYRTTKRRSIEKGKTALVRYKLHKPKHELAWGPFPYRDEEGSICYPQSSGGGWVWREEYLQAEKMFDNVEFVEAWVLDSNCTCQPFADIPRYYLERLAIGKEGAGIVIKLGCNSVYGKLAQSIGEGMFNSWIWAGLVTSGTRAQILEILEQHSDPANLLMVATDGIYTREKIAARTPRDTGTDLEVTDRSSGKTKRAPLGGWESKTYENGVFVARPGIYFPLNPTTDDLDVVRARGIGKSVLLENWQTVVDAYVKHGVGEKVLLSTLVRFNGAKTSISRSGDYYKRSGVYGQWTPRPTDMSFDPMPKRSGVRADNTLIIRDMPLDRMSTPYSKAMRSKDADDLTALEIVAEEQPDLTLGGYS